MNESPASPNAHAARIRAFHLDLKGLPPTADRLVSLLPIVRAAGYNALLVEWENMFPWTVDPQWRAPTAYSRAEVERFHAAAQAQGLTVIPLVQTLGHLEMALSPAIYQPLRARPNRCDTLNPQAKGARELLTAMLEDVLALGPAPQYFHVGGDEANLPDEIATGASRGEAMWAHYEPLFALLRARGIRPLIWHDMIGEMPMPILCRFAEAADVAAWGYRGHPDTTTSHFHTRVIERLIEAGATVWGSTAFKGADGAQSDLPNLDARLENARAWVEVAQRYRFHGLIATAWSRYASFRVQCEPGEAAMDAMFAVGGVLQGLSEADIHSQCEVTLRSMGEWERYQQCRAVMETLTAHTHTGWLTARALREQLVMEQRYPQRAGSCVADQLIRNLRRDCRRLAELAEPLRQAFAGRVAPLWIDQLLEERLLPIQDELDELSRRYTGGASGVDCEGIAIAALPAGPA